MRLAIIAIVMVLSRPVFATGQTVAVADTMASLLVIVHDTAGRPIAQAKIDVMYVPDTGGRHIITVTDSAGRSFLGGLAPGGCRVAVRAIGAIPMIWNRVLRPGAMDTLRLVMGGKDRFPPGRRRVLGDGGLMANHSRRSTW